MFLPKVRRVIAWVSRKCLSLIIKNGNNEITL